MERVGGTSLEGDRRCLCHAIAVSHISQVKSIDDFGHKCFRTNCPSYDTSPQIFNIVMSRILLIVSQILDKHGRNSIEGGALIFAYGTQSFLWVESLTDNSKAASPHYGSQCAHNHSKAMIERNRDSNIVSMRILEFIADDEGIIENIVVGKSGGFRSTSGARCELDISWVIGVHIVVEKG